MFEPVRAVRRGARVGGRALGIITPEGPRPGTQGVGWIEAVNAPMTKAEVEAIR